MDEAPPTGNQAHLHSPAASASSGNRAAPRCGHSAAVLPSLLPRDRLPACRSRAATRDCSARQNNPFHLVTRTGSGGNAGAASGSQEEALSVPGGAALPLLPSPRAVCPLWPGQLVAPRFLGAEGALLLPAPWARPGRRPALPCPPLTPAGARQAGTSTTCGSGQVSISRCPRPPHRLLSPSPPAACAHRC